MPKFKFQKAEELVSSGSSYKILFPLRESKDKKAFFVLRQDPLSGLKQEAFLKIYLERTEYAFEFESLKKVKSPYCVQFLSFERFDSYPALLLEYIKGASLFDLLKNFSLNEKQISFIKSSIYKGLKDLNDQGLSHGDLSPGNVLINLEGRVKLIDFGKANYESSQAGTPPFVAPELFKGARSNFLCDLYSLGALEEFMRDPLVIEKKDLSNFNKSLLHPDPLKRKFVDEDLSLGEEDRKDLCLKVKDLFLIQEKRRLKTIKNLNQKRNKKTPIPFFLRTLSLLFLLTFFSASSSLEQDLSMLKVYTNKWVKIKIGNIESYSPALIPLKPGKYTIYWENKDGIGRKKIEIARDEEIVLSDKSFELDYQK